MIRDESGSTQSLRRKLDYDTLESLRQDHPAWRLLRSDHAPLVASFLHRAFVAPNNRVLPENELAEALEDELFTLRQRLGEGSFPKRALEYLDDWAQPERPWLRKFYREDSDEPHFDLMPATEKVIAWLGSLSERRFVGTESRLVTLLGLLKQISTGAEDDPDRRIQELELRKRSIEQEIEQVQKGHIPLLEDTAVMDRFQQFTEMSRDLLTDFREVEQNFRTLDRQIRERIALWEGSKKEVLEEFLGRRDAIADSPQGRSFQAFWDFLMARDRLDEFTALLERALALPAIKDMAPDVRTRRVHYDWMDAGSHTQRTVAQLSHQLRRFLDDRAHLENRRIMELLRAIEKRALALRDAPPEGNVTEVAGISADINLPMDRPMYQDTAKQLLADTDLELGDEDLDTSALYEQVVVDKSSLIDHIRRVLQDRSQVTLQELSELRPLEHGLTELLAYLQLAADPFDAVVDPDKTEVVFWRSEEAGGGSVTRAAKLPRVIFVR